VDEAKDQLFTASAHLEICTNHVPALVQDLETAVRTPTGKGTQSMLL
jgi:hypothetical protein